jgi:cell shape-determining protein MreC
MSFNGLLVLLFAQIGIDVALIVVFFAVLRKMREPEKKLDKRIELFESLLIEADTTTQKFKERLDEKHRLIRSLNEELDKRILSLNVLLNRAEVLLSRNRKPIQDQNDTPDQDSIRAEILEFARQGYKTEHIAKKLSMPKEEVKLVLDMRGKTARH